MPDGFFGIYRAVVTSNADPQHRRRLQVDIADLGVRGAWAEICLSTRAPGAPPPSSGVWVMFEAGDLERPVWLGRRL